jgi:DNA-binding transcriptional regulator YiaG
MHEDLGPRLKEHRDRLNLSQRELADWLGVSVRAIQTWESGQAIPIPQHRRMLARFLATETIELEERA